MSNTFAHDPYAVSGNVKSCAQYKGVREVSRAMNRQERYDCQRALARGGVDAVDQLPSKSAARGRAPWLVY